jgi:hypothetical protein
MWLILGAYALGGCIIAAMQRGWLTQGAHWKDKDKSDKDGPGKAN